MRKWLNYKEEIIFAEQFRQDGLSIFEPIRAYLDDTRVRANLTSKKCNETCGSQMATHYVFQYLPMVPTNRRTLQQIKRTYGFKPYEEIKQEYGNFKRVFNLKRRTFNLTADRQYNNTWNFQQTPSRKGRHPCEKLGADKSYNRNQ